jgi:HEAT repeat protein
MPLFGPPNIEKMEARGDVEGLIKALEYWKGRGPTNRKVQMGAAQALARIGDARAVEPLVRALDRYDDETRHAVAEALGKMGVPAVGLLIRWYNWLTSGLYLREAITEVVGKVGAPAAQPLVAALRDSRDYVRWAAPELLDSIGWQPKAGSEDEAAYWAAKVELLMARLRHKYALDPYARKDVRPAVASLVKMGGPAVKPLIAALKDKDELVRQAANESLAEIGGPAVAPLIAALGVSATSEAAATALKRMGPAAVEPLVAALQGDDDPPRWGAITVLAEIGDVRAVEPLAALVLRTNGDYTRSSAFWALNKIGNAPSALLALEPDEQVWWQKGLAGKCERCGRFVFLSVARTETDKYWDGEWWQKSQPYYVCPFCSSSSGGPSAKLL